MANKAIIFCEKHQVFKEKNASGRNICKLCKKEFGEKYRESHKEEIRQKNIEYYNKNRERYQELLRVYRKRDPERFRKYNNDSREKNKELIAIQRSIRGLKISVEQYLEMVIKCDNKCSICEKEEILRKNGIRRRLCLDHDHTTGVVRDLLCVSCNAAIGHFKDDVYLMKKAIDYLIKHKGTILFEE